VDSLNIEPQTFCGLITMKETVTDKQQIFGTACVIKTAKTRRTYIYIYKKQA